MDINYITNTCTIVTYHSYPLVNIQKNYGKSPSLMLIIMIFPYSNHHFLVVLAPNIHHVQIVIVFIINKAYQDTATAGIFDGLIRLENNT